MSAHGINRKVINKCQKLADIIYYLKIVVATKIILKNKCDLIKFILIIGRLKCLNEEHLIALYPK